MDLVTRLILNSSNFDSNIKKTAYQIDKFKSNITGIAASVGKFTGGLAAFAGISMTLGDAVQTTIKFEKTLSSLKALTQSNAKDMEFFKDSAISMSKTSTKSANEIAEAFQLIGGSSDELLKNKKALVDVTNQAIILSEAAGIDVPSAAQALIGSINQMGVSADKAAEFVNILAAGAGNGAAEIPYLNDAIFKAGGTASATGVQFNELVAAIETMAPKITEASTAGLNLRNIFLTLERSTNKNLRPSVVGFTKALDNLAAKQLNVTKLTEMFGKENVTGALALLQNINMYHDMIGAVTGTNMALEQQAIVNDNADASLKKLSNTWDAFVLHKSGNNSLFRGAIDSATEFISKLDEITDSKAWNFISSGLGQIAHWTFNSSIFDIKDAALDKYDDLQRYLKGINKESQRLENSPLFKGFDYNNLGMSLPFSTQPYVAPAPGVKTEKKVVAGGGEGEGEERAVKNSLKWYDQEIAKLQKKFENTADAGLRAGFLSAKTELNDKKLTLELDLLPVGSTERLEKQISIQRNKLSLATSDQSRAQISKTIKDMETELKMFRARQEGVPLIITPQLNMVNLWAQYKEFIDKQKSGRVKEDIDSDKLGGSDITKFIPKTEITKNNDYEESLSNITSAMQTLSNVTDSSAVSWLSWGASLASSVSAAIPALKSLFAAQAAVAVAESAKSAAAVPFVGWINAIAAVAALSAAFLSMPKFATGGMPDAMKGGTVGGGYYVGDKLAVRVNSGEMILNKGQQSRLFNILNGSGSVLRTPSRQELVSRIEGTDLVLMIKNVEKKNGRI
ncbi:phage tail tape measure protein [Parabacteroides sp. Marseille-P3160]|uniref:phage tail tape measure protein n=1 Tax=Parabacteroides sp. Marseille-P3160 TaxID=1917887 RepID=UPI0009BB08A6|nr:phage tail tape measure protein [Parabacteroides sp. Marseille-P3160]